MKRWLVLLLVLPVSMITFGTGCSCDSYCDYEAERWQFTGELLETDGTIFVFSHSDGPVLVGVTGRENFLDVGEEYRVTAVRSVRTDVEWASHVNGGCGCTEINITHPDGARLDTGVLARLDRMLPFRTIAFGLLAVPVATLVVVAVHRLVVGRDRDLMRDMPFDEWVDIDD